MMDLINPSLWSRQTDPYGDVIETIGLVVDAGQLITDIVGLAKGSTPGGKTSSPTGAHVRIKSGLAPGNSDAGLGGNVDDMDCYDANNVYLGNTDGAGTGGDHNSDGGFMDLMCNNPGAGRSAGIQTDYITIEAGGDSICIAWVDVEQYDGSDSSGGAWTGDIGKYCGIQWYYNSEIAGRTQNGTFYRPFCSWFDKDHSDSNPNWNGIRFGAFKFNVQAYGEKANDTLDTSHECASTLFQTNSNGIDGQPYTPGKRSIPTIDAKRETSLPISRHQWMLERLVVSSIPEHTARYMCEDDLSYGPDFVGADGHFCDMGTKTLIPLCSTKNVPGCIHTDIENKRIMGVSLPGNAPRANVASVPQVLREYKEVTQWSE